MDKDQPKKCFCTRCFLPIEPEDKVDVDGQNFHRICSMCCVCRAVPKSIKMFYGHVFCNDCFKTHVLGRFKETPRMHSSSWWTQWAPGMKPQNTEKEGPKAENCSSEEHVKKLICSRCLQGVVGENVNIGGQHFHPQCAKCYFCQTVPTHNLKIYYGQVFCEECFHRHVLNRNRDNPAEFFKTCFSQWQNVQFNDGMRQFMEGSREGSNPPFIFCHSSGQNEWSNMPGARKSSEELKNMDEFFKTCLSLWQNVQFAEGMRQFMEGNGAATPVTVSSIPEDEDLEDLTFENRTEASELAESYHGNEDTSDVPAAEKIEKLTKYLHVIPSQVKSEKKWKNFVESDKISLASYGWVDLQDDKVKPLACPKCLWQCGPIYVKRELLQRQVCGGDAF